MKEDALATSPLSLMQEEPRTTPLRVVAASPSQEPCCHPVSECRFRPGAIKWALERIEEYAHSGLSPVEALMAVATTTHDGNDGPPGFGPKEPSIAMLSAEIARALKAGHRNPWEISKFLCPLGYDMARALAVSEDDD